MGGETFRFVGFWFLYLLALAPIFIGIGSSKFSLITRTTMVAVGVLIIICLLVLPFREWFPGFAVYPESASLIVRNSAELTFAGVLLSIFGTALGIYFSYKFSLKKDKKKETNK
jgi:ABC-type Mn2+/Zn2+ transport system permease subunit